MADKTRREILSEAFDDAEKSDEGSSTKSTGGGEEEQSPDTRASSEGEQDTKGTDTEKPGEGEGGGGEEVEAKGEKKEVKPEKEEKPVKETADQKEARAAQEATRRTREATRPTDKAPNSWKPGAREDWGKIPAAARAEIGRREIEIQRELSQTATVRRFANDLATVIQPHLPIIQAQKTTPLAAIDTLMKTASSLYQGNQEQKSRIVAQIIQDYGIDVRILDKVLSAQPVPPNFGGQNNGSVNPNAVPPWAQPIFSFMTQAEAARQQREMDMQTDATAEVEAAKVDMPFLDDLREDVADILEFAAKRGKVVTLAQAYERAVSLDPEISKIANQRKLAATQKGGDTLAKARRAASTIKGSPSGGAAGGSKSGKQTRKEILREAWDSAET